MASKLSWLERSSVEQLGVARLAEHSVRIYPNRLAIHRRDGRDTTWEEAQAIKQEIWGDRIAIEVYPPEHEVVNFRPTRHLWSTPELESAVRFYCRHPEFFNA